MRFLRLINLSRLLKDFTYAVTKEALTGPVKGQFIRVTPSMHLRMQIQMHILGKLGGQKVEIYIEQLYFFHLPLLVVDLHSLLSMKYKM